MVDSETKEYVDEKLDGIYNLIEGLKIGLDGRIEGIRAEISGLDKKFDGLYRGLDAKMDGLDTKMDSVLAIIPMMLDEYRRFRAVYEETLVGLKDIKEELKKGRIGFAQQEKTS